MTDSDDPSHRLRHRARGDDIEVREPDEVEDEDGMMEVRMPIATTGDVRNEGDDPLTRAELDGMATQLTEREIGVFPAHGGDTMIASGRYSPFEKLGTWREGDVDSREGDDVLMATARMPDPETLPAATGDYRQGLAILKEQATRGIAQDASIGWRDDESFPGGVDLMEASIVGIGADWRTNTGDEKAEVVARAAVEAGANPDELVATVRAAVESDPETPENTHDMSDDDTTSADDAGDTTDDEQDAPDDGDDTTERADAPEWAARMLDLLESLNDAVREGDKDDDEDEGEQESDDDDDDKDDDEDEQSADAPDDEQDGDPDDTQDADDAGIDERIAELEDAVDDLRNGDVDVDVDTPDTDEEQDADADDDTDTGSDDDGETTDRDAESPTDGLGDYR